MNATNTATAIRPCYTGRSRHRSGAGSKKPAGEGGLGATVIRDLGSQSAELVGRRIQPDHVRHA